MQTTTPAAQPKDNLFGICAALGEDFGFNPLWLRVVLAAALLWNAELVAAGYSAVGLVVLATRLLFPNAKRASAVQVVAAQPVAAQPDGEADAPEPLLEAA